jgi:hypothetical protein
MDYLLRGMRMERRNWKAISRIINKVDFGLPGMRMDRRRKKEPSKMVKGLSLLAGTKSGMNCLHHRVRYGHRNTGIGTTSQLRPLLCQLLSFPNHLHHLQSQPLNRRDLHLRERCGHQNMDTGTTLR